MGRPRNNSTEIPAKEKIENAFWELLEKEGFRNVTILRLTQESGVNRNSIYYHYENIEDLAQKAFEHNADSQFVTAFMSSILTNDSESISNQKMILHVKRIHLLAGSKSSFLQSLVRKSLVNAWFKIFNIDSSTLSDSDLVVLNFIAAGVTDMLGSDILANNPNAIRSFPFTPLGKTAIQALQNMSHEN